MNKKGQMVDTSRSGGLNVSQMWQKLLLLNEDLAARGEMVMDDDEIVAAMLLAFPDRGQSQVMYHVNRIRSRFNRGNLPGQKEVPKESSSRWKWLNGRPTRLNSRGYPLPENQQLHAREGT